MQGAQRLFSAWLEGQMLERGLPGIAVGVVADQELVWSAGFGFADSAARIPMTPQTKFRMASHSKLFTATAVMQLREQGKLRLDDPVSRYLPWFMIKPAESDDNHNAKELSGGRFDLVLRSSLPVPFLIVIECKVAPDARTSLARMGVQESDTHDSEPTRIFGVP